MPRFPLAPAGRIDDITRMPRAAAVTGIEPSPRGSNALRDVVERALSIPLLGKLAGANLLIVLAALAGVAAEHRFNASGNVVSILGVALGTSLVVNLVLVYVALRPLNDLEAAAARVSAGDLDARVAPSMLADRDMARVGTTLNGLLDRLTEDRARVRRLAAQVISAQDEERAREIGRAHV